jgi:biopolymer transport protein ExbD
MSLFGGLFFLLSAFYFSTYWHFTSPEPYLQLPASTSSSSCHLLDGPLFVISIDKQSRFFLSTGDKNYTTRIVRRVAARHRVTLTPDQLDKLDRIPFLTMNVRHLPRYLALSLKQRYQFNEPEIPRATTDSQIVEYIAAANSVAHEDFNRKASFIIRADSNLPFPQVQRIMHLLQQQGENHINLATNVEMRDPAFHF